MSVHMASADDPMVRPILDWLEGRGIYHQDIKRVALDAEIGQPVIVTVDLIVRSTGEDAR